MSQLSTKITATLFSLATLASANAMDMANPPKDMEKCYGVARMGQNDCGNAAGTHGCAGNAKVDADGGEWLFLPKGTCEKLVGGSLNPKS
jgi:uncharacterized membrane protein